MDEWFPSALKLMTRVIEIGGIAIIVLGILGASLAVVWQVLRGRSGSEAFTLYRSNLGRAILLGLEFLVAADIINTVVVELNIENVLSLALIVLIRTLLSLSLETEIEGRFPWQRGERRPEPE